MNEIFDTQMSFADMGLGPPLLEATTKHGFVHPTMVQARLIPLALKGADILGQSKTGTGKTAAFALPMLQLIQEHEHFAGLVLVPTRELAIQVTHEFREMGRFLNLKTVPVYGGQKISVQVAKLEKA